LVGKKKIRIAKRTADNYEITDRMILMKNAHKISSNWEKAVEYGLFLF